MESKIGLVKYVASTKGVKFDGDFDWYNPTEEAKSMVKESMNGHQCEIQLIDKNKFSSIVDLENPEGTPELTETSNLSEKAEQLNKQITAKQESREEKESSKEREETDLKYYDDLEAQGFLTADQVIYNEFDPKFVEKTISQRLNTKSKNGLNYASWAEAWFKLIQLYPKATYKVLRHPRNFMPYFRDEQGYGFVEVEVTANGISHSSLLPIMDYKNTALKNFTSFDVNKSIQRALTKAIAMHGLGLYIYNGEDIE